MLAVFEFTLAIFDIFWAVFGLLLAVFGRRYTWLGAFSAVFSFILAGRWRGGGGRGVRLPGG